MSFENENVLQTTVNCSESPGDNTTIINTLISEDCSMLPICDDNSMNLQSLNMPLLEDSEDSTDIDIKLIESNTYESSPSVEDKEFLTKIVIENESNRINPTNIVLEDSVSQESNKSFVVFESVDFEAKVFSNDSPLINNIKCQPEKMDNSDDCKYTIFENPLTVTTEKSAFDYCTAGNENEISEFLIFRKTDPPTDTKLEYGCFVNLERINFPVVREKRNTKAIDRYYPSPKRMKASKTAGALNRLRKQSKRQTTDATKVRVEKNRNKSLYKTVESSCDDSPSRCNEQSKIVLRLVRPKYSSFYQCFNVSNIREHQNDPATNGEQPIRELRSSTQIILPKSNASRSSRSKDRGDTRNVHSKNVRQPIQLHSRVDKRTVLPELKPQRLDPSKDQSYTKRSVNAMTVKPPAQLHFSGNEQTMTLESKADRLYRSKDQSDPKRNLNSTSIKQPAQLHSSGHERTMKSEATANRPYQIKDRSKINRDVYYTKANQPVQLHSIGDIDKRMILPESNQDNSPHLYIPQSNSNNMDEVIGTIAVETITRLNGVVKDNAFHQKFQNFAFDQPLDLTISKKHNLSNSLEEFPVMEAEQSIAKEMSPICNTIKDSPSVDKIKQNLIELFGNESLSSDDEDPISPINSPQRDVQAFNVIDKNVVAGRDSDDESSVCSELSIFAPSLSELSDSPPAKRSPPRIAKNQNNIFDIKNFRIPKIKRNPGESEKQVEAERPNNKPQTLDTFGIVRNVAKAKKQKKKLVKKVIKPLTEPINIAPKNRKPLPNINETVEQKKAENPIIAWKLMPLENLPVGGSIHPLLNVSKPKTSQDSGRCNIPKNINNVTNTTNCSGVPADDIFRTCLNDSKCSSNPLSATNPTHRNKITILENYQIQVSNRDSTIRNVRCVPNHNEKNETAHGDTSTLSITNEESHIPLHLMRKVPTNKPLPLFPMMQKSTLSSLPQMYKPNPQFQEQIPQMLEQSTQIQKLASSSTTSIPKMLNSSADVISLEKRKLYRSKVAKMLDGPCFSFLANRQCGSDCRYNHILPSIDIIKKKLSAMPDEFIQFMYTDFISKNTLLFETFFPVICQLYSQRKLHPQFFQFIKDCEKFGKQEYIRFVFDGLSLCLNKRDALLQIISNCQVNSANDEIILQIIETDPLRFIDILITAPRFTLNSNIMTKLLKEAAEKPEPELVRNCTDLLAQIGETMLNIDRNVLNTFCAKVFAFGDVPLSQKMLKLLEHQAK